MVSGAFKRFKHEHIFTGVNGEVLMTDAFDYTSPYGIFGRIADAVFLKRYMTNLLLKRNAIVKAFAEDPAKYKTVLTE